MIVHSIISFNFTTLKGEFKEKQHKKATRVCKPNSFSDETKRWKLHNSMKLENQEGVWKSDDLWIFKTKDNDLVYIENTSKTKVLQATSDGKVIQEVFEEGKAEQLWKKGKPMAQDYFTLESHSEVPKVITAISESVLEIKGNICNSEMDSYRKVASSNTSRFEAHAGLFRLSMKGILDDYVLLPIGKNFIFELVSHVRTRDYTVIVDYFI